MSAQIIHIPQLLTANELIQIDDLIATAHFVDGKTTASSAAKEVKNNLQITPNDTALQQIQSIINTALQQSPLFNIAALPKQIYPFVVSKYQNNQSYGWHVDSPIMGSPAIRTDLAMTIFLSDPNSYQGGSLMIQNDQNVVTLKPAKGDAVLYPCQFLHCVEPITAGERLAAVSWIQSNVKDSAQRQILFQLNQVHGALHEQAPHAPATNLLLQTHSNLFRMWADV
ncbi:Fe2+-dependent dioxygenase [Ferruginibacter yonginensis]|uniref:Fe2+-dependent dioxygenase n=1 Tax=Ferruginibacter yonginensis TaxID=1310416 RepID=A0ABV8QU81_9BACT